MKPIHSSTSIQWSNRDQAYLVNIPELPGYHAHGHTYEEALKNGLEVMKLWIEAADKDDRPVPQSMVTA